MNINDNQAANNEQQCCVDFCTNTFHTPVGEIVNAYKCDTKQVSASDIWSIQHQRRQLVIGANISVTG